MKLTRASSYALHAVAYMAQQKTNSPIASDKIAKVRDIPARFLLKVLKPLVSARVLQSIKGPNGGYKLARPATNITILEIVEAVDGAIQGQPSWTERNNASLNHKIESICQGSAEVQRKFLEKQRLSDLVTGKAGDGKKKTGKD
jgi:Rrf2 family protein